MKLKLTILSIITSLSLIGCAPPPTPTEYREAARTKVEGNVESFPNAEVNQFLVQRSDGSVWYVDVRSNDYNPDDTRFEPTTAVEIFPPTIKD